MNLRGREPLKFAKKRRLNENGGVNHMSHTRPGCNRV